jgi:endonuclease/exonuclease/phosphatase family metal-dependent hydrolase
MRTLVRVLGPSLLLTSIIGCTKKGEVRPPEPAPSVGDVASEGAPESDEDATAEKQPKETFRVATFNLQWAHDHRRTGTAQAKKARAKDEEAWTWKADAIGKILAQHAPEIVVLQELGGEDEIYDIIAAIKESGGPQYDYAYIQSEDPFTGHQVAVISTYRLTDARRLDIHLRRHVVVDVDLPDDQKLTVVAIHAPEGDRGADARDKQIKALKRAVDSLRSDNPVVVAGTLGTGILHTDGKYPDSPAGVLAGKSTKDERDDCFDSVAVGAIVSTTRSGTVADRIYACGVEMIDADAHEEGIVRGTPDADDKRWSDIPVDERDVSDHLLVVAEIKRPKPAPEKSEDEAENGDAAADG